MGLSKQEAAMLVDFLEVEAAEIHLIDPAIGGCEDSALAVGCDRLDLAPVQWNSDREGCFTGDEYLKSHRGIALNPRNGDPVGTIPGEEQ